MARQRHRSSLALAIHAWNTHRAGGARTVLQTPRGGLTPESFPEPPYLIYERDKRHESACMSATHLK